jgi:hypothetical protein
MQNQMIRLPIPVPPDPILEHAVGYQNERNAHYFALWWEPCGDEAMVSDGYITFTGHWPGYLAFVQHERVHPHLAAYNLGSSEDPAKHRLVINLLDRQAYAMSARDAEQLLDGQWQPAKTKGSPRAISMEDLEAMLSGFIEQTQATPTMDELSRQMENDHQAVIALQNWLDNQV